MDKNTTISKYFQAILLKKLGVLLILVGIVLLFLGHWYISAALIIIGIILIQFLKCPNCNKKLSGGIISKLKYCDNCCHELPQKKNSNNKEEEI